MKITLRLDVPDLETAAKMLERYIYGIKDTKVRFAYDKPESQMDRAKGMTLFTLDEGKYAELDAEIDV